MQSVDTTNGFIKNLLTTTPSSSHVSDFRKQKRTDSRADKPDTFPGFDLHEDSTTLSPRKRRRQAYSKLIRLFLQNTRDRLETIRDVVREESELHFRLTQPSGESSENAGDSMRPNAEIRYSNGENNDDANRQFVDFAFADATRADDEPTSVVQVENANSDNAREYLNSLFAAVGYSRITTTTSNPIGSDETSKGNIISRYLINPLLSAWNATRERFNLNTESDNSTLNDNAASDGQTAIFRVNFFDNSVIKPKMQTNPRDDTNKEPNENRVDNINYSLPLIQLTAPNNVTSVVPTNETMAEVENANRVNASEIMLDVDYIGADHSGSDKKPRNTSDGSTEDAAAVAFRNAFLRYSNYMQHSMEYAKRNTSNVPVSSENAKFTQDNRTEMKSSKLLDAGLFTGNSLDSNASHIQMVPNKKLKTNGSTSESVTIANNVDDSTELNAKSFGENAGILILEIFGTVIGMTWRAVSEIPNYFQQQNQKADA